MNDESTKTPSSMGRIPFYVSFGVTGHRSLPDSDQIAERIREIFRGRFRECFDQETSLALPGLRATPIAFTVVSALATGADQLVARIAMERQALLNVVLPFAKEEYLKDFAPEPLVHFNDLLQSANRCVQLEGDVAGAVDPDEARREGYLQAGKYVVEHCGVLIAIWDGEAARGKGGTGAIVSLALKMKKPLFIISPKPPYEVTLKNGGALRAVGLREIEEFNSICIPESAIAARVEKEFSALYAHPGSSEIAESLRQSVRERLLPRYARASMISEENQKWYKAAGAFCYILSTLSVAVLAFTIVFLNHDPSSAYGFMIELLLLITLLLVIYIAHREQVHRLWLENRALAERLRVAFFFVSCGINPVPASKCPRPFLDDCSGWIGTAYGAVIDELPEFSEVKSLETFVLNNYLRSCWILPQMEYHKRKSGKIARRNRVLQCAGVTLFVSAIIVSGTHILLAKLAHRLEALKDFKGWISVVAVTLPAAGAAVTGYRTLMEFPRISSRCSFMTAQLQCLADKSKSLSTRKELMAFLAETEELMLNESQDWVKLIRFADLKKVP